MRVRSLALLPFSLLWSLVKLLFWPGLGVFVAWLVLPVGWMPLVFAGAAGYVVAVLAVWKVMVRGKFASLARGTVTVRPTRKRGDER